MKKKNLAIYFLLIVFSTMTLQAANAKKIVKKFLEHYKNAPYISIQYQQKVVLSLTNNLVTHRGTLVFSNKSNLFRLEDEDQIMAVDGKNFYRLNKKANQLTIDYLKKGDQVFFFRKLFKDVDKHFYIDLISEKKIKKDKLFVLKLTPKEDENQLFKEVKIWLLEKKNLVVKIEMKDLNDNITTYEINQLKIRNELSPGFFSIKESKGMEVIDLRL